MRRKISLKHKETKQGARSVVHRFRRSTIFRKFLIAYVLFAVFGFIATGTLVESMTGNYVKRNQAARLYAAAMQIAGTGRTARFFQVLRCTDLDHQPVRKDGD